MRAVIIDSISSASFLFNWFYSFLHKKDHVCTLITAELTFGVQSPPTLTVTPTAHQKTTSLSALSQKSARRNHPA
jgi:hypothetical protein